MPPSASSHYAASTSKGLARPELEQYPPTACSGRQGAQALVKTVRNKLECKYEGFTYKLKGLLTTYKDILQCRLQRRLRPIYCDPQDHTLLVLVELPGGFARDTYTGAFFYVYKADYSRHLCALI